MYAKFIKRILDFFVALTALLVLSPVMVILTVLGAIKMKGNPFFTQLRPGRKEKIFRLLKFGVRRRGLLMWLGNCCMMMCSMSRRCLR